MRINAISTNFTNKRINNVQFGKNRECINRIKPDKDDIYLREIENKSKPCSYSQYLREQALLEGRMKPVDMSKILEENIIKPSTSLSREEIRRIENMASRDELGENPSDGLLLLYLMNGGDMSILTDKEKSRLEAYMLWD